MYIFRFANTKDITISKTFLSIVVFVFDVKNKLVQKRTNISLSLSSPSNALIYIQDANDLRAVQQYLNSNYMPRRKTLLWASYKFAFGFTS